jgi:hypothetical protein
LILSQRVYFCTRKMILYLIAHSICEEALHG